MTSSALFVRNTTRVMYVMALLAVMVLFVLTGCFKKQQAPNTNTANENTNATNSATTTATENGNAAKQDTAQKEEKPATNTNVSNTNAVIPPAAGAAPSFTFALGARNGSQQTGSVLIINLDEGKTHVTVRLSGSPLNTPQPVNMHTGTCASMGPVRHVLNNVVNGTSDTILLIPYETLIAQAPFSVSVHKSNPEYSVLVACGDKL